MTDVSGIPNMGFGGGGFFGGIPNVAPAMSAAQINQGIWGNYSPQQAQHTLNNIYGPQGFGGQTAQHAALGAALGRATGGFGGLPGRVGTISNPGSSNPGYLTPTASRNTLASMMASRGRTTDFSSQSRPSGGGIGSDMLRGNQNQPYAQAWHSLIPANRSSPELIKSINYAAGRHRFEPAALAGVGSVESKFNPQLKHNSYFGTTQMGAPSFAEAARAGRPLGGMNWNQYKAAPADRQINAYSDWLAHYARPGNAAGLATSDIRGHSVPMQSSILQGTQFGPNRSGWPAAFAQQGNTSMLTTGPRQPQAEFLGNNRYPTLNSMNDYFTRLHR